MSGQHYRYITDGVASCELSWKVNFSEFIHNKTISFDELSF